MKYNFDEIIERRGTNSMNTDGFREYIFHADNTMKFPYKDEEFVRMWIADMEFATPDVIINAIKERLDKRIFGYTKIFDPEYYKAFAKWTQKRYDWHCEKKDLVTSPGIIPALYELVSYITKEDENVLIMTPSYAFFKHAVDYHHRKLVCSDLINEDGYYKIDFDDLEKKLKTQKLHYLFSAIHIIQQDVFGQRKN
ncbi:aminotransferase, class I and II [Clostridium carboxidivorans P7]|uniref:cysteine-S-conjugate beta-lyase n=1 Tax=Clostridium carboxidivorans P7 TaxID=536227 RepID=C6PX48_9CLOT|nr:aminotransferase, class I and II [Clostridium carboxidivorans P7]